MDLKVLKLRPEAFLPKASHPGEDLGYDVFSPVNITVRRGEVAEIPLGIALKLEGYGFLVCDRSSLAQLGITVLGGVIDTGYRGEIIVLLTGVRLYQYQVCRGDKIAQLVPVKSHTAHPVVEVEELDVTLRGANAFGSSGR